MKDRITAMELKMQNLSLPLKCTFVKINSLFFCPAFFYSTLINTLLKVALKKFQKNAKDAKQ